MRERDKRSDSRSETDAATSSPSTSSPSNSSSGDSAWENNNSSKRHGKFKRKRSISMSRDREDSTPSSSSSSGSSDIDVKRRKSRSTRGKEKKYSHRRDKSDREKEKKKERKRRSRGIDDKHGRKEKHRRKEKHDREKRKRKVAGTDSVAVKDDVPMQLVAKSTLQVMNEAQLQQKEIVRRNVEIAKARLASGELQRMKHEQMEMQRLYGTVDWREKKKLRAEKSRLERTVAAGQKLANIEERENARMDAFRVALGLPTAEAQRQAEWRAEATRALAAEAVSKDNLSPSVGRVPSRSRKVIGPRLPH